MAYVDVPGAFVWHDLLTPNRAGAQEFYGNVVNWKSAPWENDESYTLFSAARGPVGGVMENRAATPHWLPYISTSSVDETAEAASRLGARLETPPTDLPNGGRYALLVDPQGAPFGIHASAARDEGQASAASAPGEFSWHELATNVAPSIAFGFYAALFDWDLIREHDMGPMGTYLLFGRDGRELGGVFDQTAAGKTGPAYWLGYVSTNDLEGTVERAKAARASVLVPPMDVPGGDRIAQLMDPHGAFFALHQAASRQPATDASSAEPPSAPPKRARARAKPAAKPAAKKRRAKKAPAKRAKAAPRKKAAKRAATKRRPAAKKPAAKKRAGAKKRPAPRKAKPAARKPAKKKAAKKRRGR